MRTHRFLHILKSILYILAALILAVGLISGLGVFDLIFSLTLSLLLFAIGRLLEHFTNLETRLSRLETRTGASTGW